METEVEVSHLDRKLTCEELLTVVDLFLKTGRQQGTGGHPLVPFYSRESTYATLCIANENGYLEAFAVNDCVVGVLMYDIARPWWSNAYCLKEMLVLTVDPRFKGFGRIALERLQEIAVENGCDLIESGSALCLDSKAVENLYMKKGGFQFTYPNFVKINE